MLQKPSEPEITSECPFGEDKLGREKPVQILSSLIESIRQPFVLSIEAPWGQGKTTFVKMLQAYFEGVRGVRFLHFNAWECDFEADPLIPLLSCVKKAIDEESTNWEKVRTAGGNILRKGTPFLIKTLAPVLGSAGEAGATLMDKGLELFDRETNDLQEMRQGLEQLVAKRDKDKAAPPKEEGGEAEKTADQEPLVFFVDELDRCRPDFAIAVLERIKHIFAVPGIVFILSIDRQQIESSLKCLYGQEMDTDGYLRRFIDFAFKLPETEPDAYASHLLNALPLGDTLRKRRFPWGTFLGDFSALNLAYGPLSLRSQEQCLMACCLAIAHAPDTDSAPFIAFLVVLRAQKPQLYRTIREGSPDIEEIITPLESAARAVGHGSTIEQALRVHAALLNYGGSAPRDAFKEKVEKEFPIAFRPITYLLDHGRQYLTCPPEPRPVLVLGSGPRREV